MVVVNGINVRGRVIVGGCGRGMNRREMRRIGVEGGRRRGMMGSK